MPNHLWMIVLGTFAWIVGSLTAEVLIWSGGRMNLYLPSSPLFYDLCKSKLFFDEIYGFYVSKIQDPLPVLSK